MFVTWGLLTQTSLSRASALTGFLTSGIACMKSIMNACISSSVKGQHLSSGWEGGHAQARCIKLQSALVVVLAHARNCRLMYLQGDAWTGSGQHKLG